jgi:ABC-2 type transport system ATP-binding protein
MLDIGSLLKTFARELSLGQRMRADLAMLLLHGPSVIFLDEPTLGLDVVAKRRMIDFLKKLNQDNHVTIFVTSHDMDDLEEMARRVLMISKGRIAYDGGFDGLREATGNLTRFIVSTDGGRVPALDGGNLLRAENGVYEFEADAAKTPIKDMLRQLSNIAGVRDVEIKKAPIEQVIAGLYASWK